MYRRFIATVAAASIAITAFGAMPARADNDDAARALAALLGIAIVGKIIHDNKKDKKAHHYEKKHVKKNHVPHYNQPSYKPPRYQPKPRPLPRRVDRKLLPGKCFHSYRTGRGKVRMFGRRCLKNNYDFVNRLPRQCLYEFDTPRGNRRGYEARCLRDRGYRLARR